MRRDGQGVLVGAQLAAEGEGHLDRVAGRARAELQTLQFRVGAVDIQADARADHHPDHRVGDRVVEADGHPHDSQFAAAPDHGRAAVLADGFDAQDLGAAVAPAHARRERRGNRLAPGADLRGDVLAVGGQHLFRIAASGQTAFAEPPDLVGEAAQQLLFVGDEQGGRASAAEAVERDGGAFADQRVVAREGVLDGEHRAAARSSASTESR